MTTPKQPDTCERCDRDGKICSIHGKIGFDCNFGSEGHPYACGKQNWVDCDCQPDTHAENTSPEPKPEQLEAEAILENARAKCYAKGCDVLWCSEQLDAVSQALQETRQKTLEEVEEVAELADYHSDCVNCKCGVPDKILSAIRKLKDDL